VKIYTRAGDDGTTGLYFGGRISKGSAAIWLNGSVDEAQATLGWARTLCQDAPDLGELLVTLERDLWILMAEVATAHENRGKLVDDKSRVTTAMIERLEVAIDHFAERTTWTKDFVVPGETPLAAALDVARTVVRRAERCVVNWDAPGTLVGTYLNRLSDLVWAMARYAEGAHRRTTKED
jgi:cob(I)alamin adenosyltransferase